MIGRIEYVQNKNFIHRDIKPDNFLMGIGRHCNKVKMFIYFFPKKGTAGIYLKSIIDVYKFIYSKGLSN